MRRFFLLSAVSEDISPDALFCFFHAVFSLFSEGASSDEPFRFFALRFFFFFSCSEEQPSEWFFLPSAKMSSPI